jgi:hypothetical protein
VTTLDLKRKIESMRRADVPGCPLDAPCRCPTCGVTTLLLRSKLRLRGLEEPDVKRVTVEGADFRGGAYPYIASVRVDGQEVFRIYRRPDEALEEDAIRDIERRLKGEPQW